MADKEIELFFSLLDRSLGWKAERSGDIKDELRDHVNQHIEAAKVGGLSRSEAIQSALRELGEVVHLAAGLRHAVRRSQVRRFVVRSALSGAALAASVLMVVALWPDPPHTVRSPDRITRSESSRPDTSSDVDGLEVVGGPLGDRGECATAAHADVGSPPPAESEGV